MKATQTTARWMLAVFALLLVGYAILYQCFSERLIYFDEVGLFNPVYTYLHYGKMTYPAHGQFDTMFVHPPAQYFFIAMLMRTGLSVYHAAGALSVLLFAAFVLLVLTSRFPFPVQVGFLLGGFWGAFVWNQALVLRPDLTLTLAWASGLVALETARLDAWNKMRLAWGGFFLALATGIHYPGILAGTGLLVYACWMFWALGWKRARPRLAWMAVGAAVFAIPNLVLFVLPHLSDIIAFAVAVQRAAPPGTAFQHHMEAYDAWHSDIARAMPLRPVTTSLTDPLFRWHIPAGFVGPALLLLLPSTRVLALASLPHLLFILFGARHKPIAQVGYTGYFAPEVTLYLSALLSVCLSVLFAQVRRCNNRWAYGVAASAVIVGMSALATIDVPALMAQKVVRVPGVYDFEAGRSAARHILGPNAVVGTTSAGVWYTSGAAHLYFMNSDIIYPEDIHCINLKKYFASFDALAVDPHQSWSTYNLQRQNITSSYVDGLLQLRGFFFADRKDYEQFGVATTGVSYMLYAVEHPQQLVGYGVNGQTIYRFQEQPDGDQIFLSAVCPISYGERHGVLDNAELKLPFYAIFYRPVPSNDDPRTLKNHSVPAAIITLLADRAHFDRDIRPTLGACTVRDEVAGWFAQTDELRSFIHESEQTDQPIRFYPTYQEFRTTVGTLQRPQALPQVSEITDACENTTDDTALSFGSNGMLEKPPPEFTFSMPGALRLESITLAYDKASITGQSPVRIQTAPQQWAYAASIPIVLDRTPHAKRLVHIRGRVRQGQIGIGILNRKTNTFQVEKVLNPTPTAVDYYIPIPRPEAADDLIFRNTSFSGAPSEIIVDATEILAPAHRVEPWSRLTDIELAYDKASIERGTLITITTAPQQWAYAAAIPLHPSGDSRGVMLKLRAQVTSGEIGVGILASDQKHFITEQRYGQTAEPTDILLPIPSPAEGCRLIIRNASPNATSSQVVLESIETWQLD